MQKQTLLVGGIAVAAALVGGWALAQSSGEGPRGMGPGMMQHMGPGMGPGMGHGMGPGMGHGMMQGMGHGMGPGMMHGAPGAAFGDAEDIGELKAELGITPAQEQAWSKYAKAVQDAAAAIETTRQGVDRQAVAKMNPADRYAFVSKMREQRQQQVDAVKTAANDLLAALDDNQKAKAADILPGLTEFGPPMMRGADVGEPRPRN
jgi:hypothetical protein